MPLVSVVLPTHNRAHLLPGSVESVLSQTMEDIELIVVDDGSEDGTREYFDSVADPRLTVVRLAERRGAAHARNRGVSEARAGLIAFQDSDDEWFPGKLRKQWNRLEEVGSDDCVCHCRFSRNQGGRGRLFPRGNKESLEGDIYRELLHGNFISPLALLLRREQFDEVGGFNERLPALEDWDLALRLSLRYRFVLVDEPLFRVHTTRVSLSHDAEACITATKMILAEHRDAFDEVPSARARHLFYLGSAHYLMGRGNEGRRWFKRAIETGEADRIMKITWLLTPLGPTVLAGLIRLYRTLGRPFAP